MRIIVTGVTGQLGRIAAETLLEKVPADRLIAVARNVEKAAWLAEKGVEVRHGDYNDLASLLKAFEGGGKLLFVSSSEASDETLRALQHATVTRAAKMSGITHIAYTSIFRAQESPLALSLLHRTTENMIRLSGIPYTFLRNTFYTEVFVNESLRQAVESGALVTPIATAGLNTASRADMAKAAAAVLMSDGHENRIYEITAPKLWTMKELAQILSDVSGKPVVLKPATAAEYAKILAGWGMPEPAAAMFAALYAQLDEGEFAQTSDDLTRLIGETTPLETVVKRALA
ncbi:MAG: NAD(P)-dependent oxidoreductase [Thermobacillus sp.]|jgi:NAD(P)H dehydrogenase (quinone)|uniref:Triphenylmethane reductase,NADPH-dependent quinine oxidoreductase n=1 Tax=Thermobacillus xylanilyticus TaxID=76633 RepID=A0ABM8V0V7_THEXY|nr:MULTISPECIES: NmrA family NAD(P)-binding protein [Thermobacillus]REK56029.1 MAG: NAD(P)-dependent oxidoreductase [Thermobacillus sp.]CAG5079898.1 Triphenylmethane reductase,NADPH-dependent quinine oxidoreductase [Thermobacillus xylanilyticus]